MDFKAHIRQPFRHEIGGLELFETKLRVLMDMASPASQFGMEIGDAIDDRHETAPCGREDFTEMEQPARWRTERPCQVPNARLRLTFWGTYQSCAIWTVSGYPPVKNGEG